MYPKLVLFLGFFTHIGFSVIFALELPYLIKTTTLMSCIQQLTRICGYVDLLLKAKLSFSPKLEVCCAWKNLCKPRTRSLWILEETLRSICGKPTWRAGQLDLSSFTARPIWQPIGWPVTSSSAQGLLRWPTEADKASCNAELQAQFHKEACRATSCIDRSPEANMPCQMLCSVLHSALVVQPWQGGHDSLSDFWHKTKLEDFLLTWALIHWIIIKIH